MRQILRAGARILGGAALTGALLTGVGSGLFHAGEALAAGGARRADLLAAGIDMTPVGTAKQVERARQARPPKP